MHACVVSNTVYFTSLYMEVEGVKQRGRPRKTWLGVVKNYTKSLGLASGNALVSRQSCSEEKDCGGYMLTPGILPRLSDDKMVCEYIRNFDVVLLM